jgi:prefoldin subunit 5
METLNSIDIIIKEINNINEKKKHLKEELSMYDKQISSIYHELEVSKINACQGYKVAKRLQEILRKRRVVKNQLNEINTFFQSIEINNLLKKLEKTRKNVKNLINNQNKVIKDYGVLKNIFNNNI